MFTWHSMKRVYFILLGSNRKRSAPVIAEIEDVAKANTEQGMGMLIMNHKQTCGVFYLRSVNFPAHEYTHAHTHKVA